MSWNKQKTLVPAQFCHLETRLCLDFFRMLYPAETINEHRRSFGGSGAYTVMHLTWTLAHHHVGSHTHRPCPNWGRTRSVNPKINSSPWIFSMVFFSYDMFTLGFNAAFPFTTGKHPPEAPVLWGFISGVGQQKKKSDTLWVCRKHRFWTSSNSLPHGFSLVLFMPCWSNSGMVSTPKIYPTSSPMCLHNFHMFSAFTNFHNETHTFP